MIDFSTLVLAPCMNVFARPFTVTPLVSNPDAPAYEARGIYDEKPVDVQLADGNIASSTNKTIGIRLSELPQPLAQGDRIQMGSVIYFVDDTDDDGQGGSIVTIKEIRD